MHLEIDEKDSKRFISLTLFSSFGLSRFSRTEKLWVFLEYVNDGCTDGDRILEATISKNYLKFVMWNILRHLFLQL